jgi:hypothetical protein
MGDTGLEEGLGRIGGIDVGWVEIPRDAGVR